jgi:hypothetical protein
VSGTINPGEQMNPNTPNTYTGLPNEAGLGWSVNLTAATPPINQTQRRVHAISIRVIEDVLQPYAENAAAFTGVNSGQNPNYGLAGIFPFLDRVDASSNPIPDSVGFRVRATAPAGYDSWLFLSPASIPPTTLTGVGGFLCLDVVTFAPDWPLLLAIATTQAAGTHPMSPYSFPGEPASTTEAVFPPVFIGPVGALIQGIIIYAQAYTYDPVTFALGKLSCLAAVRF